MTPSNDLTEPVNAPYFMVQGRGDRVRTTGQASVRFGHKINTANPAVTDGIFAEWHWDGNVLTAVNDRYGIYPLFWFELPQGGVCISSSLLKLLELGAPVGLDIPALAVFFQLGTLVGDDTAFAAIKVMPPNALFEWQNGELRCHGRYPTTPQAAAMSRDDAIDQYIALFSQAMARRPPPSGDFAVPISGGRDSRHILLELHRTGAIPTACVSAWDNPPNSNEDPVIGKSLCDALHFRHVTVDQKLSVLAAEFRKNKETHLGASAHGWYLALADYLTNQFGCIYDGLAGDVLSQSSNLTPERDAVFRSEKVDNIANKLLFGNAGQTTILNNIINKNLRDAMAPVIAMERLSREIERHLDMPNPTSSFFFWNRTRRMTALIPYGLLGKMPTVYTPFLDHDLFDFLTTLPTNMVMDHTFHDDAIARAYPSFAHIPYANDKKIPKTGYRRARMKFMTEATQHFVFRRPSALLDNTSIRIKLLAGVMSCGYFRPWLSLSIVYLSQLESLIRRYSHNG